MKIEAIDLFCGAGGLTRGLLDAGVRVRAGFDIDGSCKHAYERNNRGAKFYQRDVAKVTAAELDRIWSSSSVRLLAGCAPCQPFSSAAHAAIAEDADPRYHLLDHFARLVRACRPELVTMENVPQVRKHKPFEDFVGLLKALSYSVWFKSVACTDYGVPQTRRRLVLMASRLGTIGGPTKSATQVEALSVGAALAGLSPLQAGEADDRDSIHFARSLTPLNLARIRASRPGGTWHDWPKRLRAPCHQKDTGASYPSVYARMRADQPSPTITTQFFNFGTGRFGHPVEHRSITPREAALLQSFPASYEFIRSDEEATMSALGRMIGNAVPPKLGEAIGKAFVSHVSTSPARVVRSRQPSTGTLGTRHTQSARPGSTRRSTQRDR